MRYGKISQSRRSLRYFRLVPLGGWHESRGSAPKVYSIGRGISCRPTARSSHPQRSRNHVMASCVGPIEVECHDFQVRHQVGENRHETRRNVPRFASIGGSCQSHLAVSSGLIIAAGDLAECRAMAQSTTWPYGGASAGLAAATDVNERSTPTLLGAQSAETSLSGPPIEPVQFTSRDTECAACRTGLFDNLSVFAGLDGSKQPQDFGINAQFGGRASVNWGIPLFESLGIGAQDRHGDRRHGRCRSGRPTSARIIRQNAKLYDGRFVSARDLWNPMGSRLRLLVRELLRHVQFGTVAAESCLSAFGAQHDRSLVGDQPAERQRPLRHDSGHAHADHANQRLLQPRMGKWPADDVLGRPCEQSRTSQRGPRRLVACQDAIRLCALS